MLFALLGLHAALAVGAPPLARRWGRGVFLACALAPGAMSVYAAVQAPAVLAGEEIRTTLAWAPSLGVTGDLRLDAFGLLMVALVSGIGTLVFVYAFGYFSAPRADLGKFAATLTAFAGSMLGLVLADNLLFLFVFWELTSITSYLLIGFEDRKAEARDAAMQALLTTGIGGLALLGGLVIIGEAAGTYSLSAVLADPPTGGAVPAGLVLCLLGAFTKSAQVPFHTWLPGAMAAPTPVSAYLHSATMVKAGIYLVARFAPAFASEPGWRPLVITVGIATMLVGAWRALRQHDLKLLLAYGTVSQLGFLMVLFGVGTPKATFAGAALLLAHGIFKAALFMIVGIVDHEAHTRDLRQLSGLRRAMPATFAVAAVTAASMAGLPPLLGFISKEAAFEALVRGGVGPLGMLALIGAVVGSVLTFAYSARFVWGAFGHKRGETGLVGPAVHAPPWYFLAPVLVLGALTLVLGLVPAPADPLVNQGAVSLDPAWSPEALALWHGVTMALWLSVVVVGAGAALFAARRTVERVQALVPALPGAKEAYESSVRGVLWTAKRLTAVMQNGSLPIYLSVITVTVVVLPGAALLAGNGMPELPALAAHPMQVAVAALVIIAGLGAARSRRRFSAVLLLGAVGYGVAVLFVIQGAPDLALTQLLVETLTIVIFVLVLRHLPARFDTARVSFSRPLRAAIAVGVGVFVFAFALVAGGARTADPVSDEYLARSLSEAQGRNVVNVILVDFRSLDTLGEIVVLVVAALGITALVSATRAVGDRPPLDGPSASDRGDAASPEADEQEAAAPRAGAREPGR
ncbi:MAG: hydrogen gas-evolving membrane-bound hydrogenase subunit E [Egibacteraceae bacterium]